MPLPEQLFEAVKGQVIAVLAHQQVRQQARRGQAVIRHAPRRGGHHGRQCALRPSHIFRAHRFLPEKLARLIIQLAAHLLTDLLPLLRLGLHQLGLDHFAHHFQVLRRPDAARLRTGRARRAKRRGGLVLGFATLSACFGQALQEQLQLRRTQLLALLAEEPPGQRIKLLA